MTQPYRRDQSVATKRRVCSPKLRAWLIEVNRVPSAGDPVCLCCRCGAYLTMRTMTVDRITPGAHGGIYSKTNTRPACKSCNSTLAAGVFRKIRRTAF